MKRATREWVKKAEDDLRMAVLAAGAAPPSHDQVCFHCQQAVEKYLKALLEELGHSVPKTHDLDALAGLLLPHYPGLRSIRHRLSFLSPFAVAVRYPGFTATKRQATSAVRWATRVRTLGRPILGLREPRRRKSP
jgi:HEPN domain-containing protein